MLRTCPIAQQIIVRRPVLSCESWANIGLYVESVLVYRLPELKEKSEKSSGKEPLRWVVLNTLPAADEHVDCSPVDSSEHACRWSLKRPATDTGCGGITDEPGDQSEPPPRAAPRDRHRPLRSSRPPPEPRRGRFCPEKKRTQWELGVLGAP